ncbi:MAG: hypothetical protein WAT41_08800, partial [Flavobacteriales bacterium]
MKAQRIILLSATVIGMATAAMAQLKVNPQLGAVFTDLSNDPSGVTTKAAVGFQVGSDLRLGDRLY